MSNVIESALLADAGDRFAVVVSRFNELITERLLDGALGALSRHGVDRDCIDVIRVPGSFEIPLAAAGAAQAGTYAAVVCLGAVIQGETDHHEYINHAVADGLMRVGLDSGVPVTFGVLTCSSMEQALARAGGKAGNKGAEAALAAVEMAGLAKRLNAPN